MIPAAVAPLAAHLWQSTLFAAAAGLLTLALRRNQARARYWLWLATSYKFLLPFSWLVSVGHQFEWRSAPAIVPPAFSAVTDMVSGPSFLASFPAAKPAPDHLPVLLFAIWAIWAGGFVVVVAGWAREWLRVRAIVRAASPLPLGLPTRNTLGCHSEERSDEESLFLSSVTCGEILRFARNDDKKQKALRVVSTAARLEPGVFGIFRPVLLLPAGITARLTQAQLQAILAHELCHVRRRDNLTAAVHMLVEALFWFYPLLWWLGARMIDEREAACDEEVLQSGSQAQVYAESILKVCEFYLESPLTCMSGVTGSDLKKRVQRIMKEHFGAALSAPKKFLLVTVGLAALGVPVAVGVLAAPRLGAQSAAVPQWQIAAGGKMAFDVASVKPNKSGIQSYHMNVPFLGDLYTPTGGLFSGTNVPLINCIYLAYKLTGYQYQLLLPKLPKWVTTDRFDIEARATGNPTKDQMRLMMQSLLADRFKLAVHYETQQLPVFAAVLVKSGRTGPKLRPYSDDAPCSTTPPAPPAPGSAPAPPVMVAGGFPTVCGGIVGVPGRTPGSQYVAARNVLIGTLVSLLAQMGNLDRPVLDQTGLSGTFDFALEFTPQLNGSSVDSQADDSGPTLQEALKDQLGLKLESKTGRVDVIVIDHVEQPSPN